MSVKLMGRYEVVNELGRGAQSIVYLAKDTRLSRQVVVKQIGPGSISQNEALLREARVASSLHHHNIIPLYDLGAVEGVVYLVNTYVAGETLAQQLKRSGALPLSNAVRIVIDVLDALASAHAQGVVHHDIKPSNILIASNGQHFVMDFGISSAMAKAQNGAATQPSPYMAPEALADGGGQQRSDIYSVGMMLYEMLTAVAQGSAPDSPGSHVKLDKKLERIILQATAKRPADRYTGALEMRQVLLDYLDSAKEATVIAPDADIASTLRFLLRRIRSKSDFPAMSGIITEINQIVASESEDSTRLAQVILQDFSLTNKLLKLVNTVSYSQFGGKINTISKAVSILGFETVRNIAMSLIVMDFLQNNSQAQELKDVVVSSFFSGIVATQLSDWKNAQEVEEAMICAMFFNLGRMLTKFYFFDESEEIKRLVEKQGVEEDQAALDVLGISYNELGLGIARTWNFPPNLIVGMEKIASGKVIEESDNMGRLSVTVNMANDLCAIASMTDAKAKEEALHHIRTRYSAVADASEEKIATVLTGGLQDLSQRAKVLGIDTANSPMLKNLKVLLAHAIQQKNAAKSDNGSANSLANTSEAAIEEISAGNNEPDEKLDTEALLRDGIQDVTNTMAGEYKLNDVLQMVLETIYRGMGFKHVLVFSRDMKKNMMVARFGFGENVAGILPHFSFPLAFEADVFHLSLAKGLDVVIQDVGAPNIASKIPAWHGKAVDTRYFMLLPMMLNNAAVGLIYADLPEARKLQIDASEMSLLRTLRNQAVMAIKQKTKG